MSGHGPNADHKDPFQRKVAVTMALFTVLLAFTTMLTNQARTEAILLATEAANEWTYFQAKSTKSTVVRAELELIEQIRMPAEVPKATMVKPAEKQHQSGKDDTHHATPNLEPADNKSEILVDPDALRSRLKSDLARYERDKEEIQHRAQELTNHGRHFQHREHGFEYASTIAELAIVLASVGLLMSSNRVFQISIGVAAISAAVTAWTWLIQV